MANDAQATALRPHDTEPASAVDRVLATLKGGVPDRQGRHIMVRALLAPADAATLDTYKTSDLVALVDRAMAFLQEKPVGAPKVAVRMIAGEGAVLEILNQDMPFLLDSVFGELHARGLAIGLRAAPADQDRAHRRRQAACASPAPAIASGATVARKATSPSTSNACRPAKPRPSPRSSPTSSAMSASSSATGSRCWRACARRSAIWRRRRRACPNRSATRRWHFSKWLEAGNMTLLGMRDYRLDGDMQTGTLAADRCDGPRAAADAGAARCCAAAASS